MISNNNNNNNNNNNKRVLYMKGKTVRGVGGVHAGGGQKQLQPQA